MYYKNNKKTQCLTNPNRSALVELLADSFKTDHNMGFDNTNYITIWQITVITKPYALSNW